MAAETAKLVPTKGAERYLVLGSSRKPKIQEQSSLDVLRPNNLRGKRSVLTLTLMTFLDRSKENHNDNSHEVKVTKVKKLAELKTAVKVDVHQLIKCLYSQSFESEDATDMQAPAPTPSFQHVRSILRRERKKFILVLLKEKVQFFWKGNGAKH